jgi:HPt (histidine-containing phosphotransfer) domain-containing protein
MDNEAKPDDRLWASDIPIWDRAGLLDRMMDDAELVLVIRDTFLRDAPGQFQVLQDCLRASDLGHAARQAHLIKGASATVGAERVRAVAAAIEKASLAGDLSQSRRQLDILQTQLEQVKKTMLEA